MYESYTKVFSNNKFPSGTGMLENSMCTLMLRWTLLSGSFYIGS